MCALPGFFKKDKFPNFINIRVSSEFHQIKVTSEFRHPRYFNNWLYRPTRPYQPTSPPPNLPFHPPHLSHHPPTPHRIELNTPSIQDYSLSQYWSTFKTGHTHTTKQKKAKNNKQEGALRTCSRGHYKFRGFLINYINFIGQMLIFDLWLFVQNLNQQISALWSN